MKFIFLFLLSTIAVIHSAIGRQMLSLGLIILSIVCGCQSSMAQFKGLVSGEPLKSGSEGYGLFALPSVNGFIMGTAHVNNDIYPDLFIKSDHYNPGTYYYLFEKYSEKGVPVFSEKKKIQIPDGVNANSRSVILENASKEIHGFWANGTELKYGKFDKMTLSFPEIETVKVKNIPRGFGHFGVVELAPSSYLFLFTVSDSVYHEHPDKDIRRARRSYGPEGFWQNPLSRSGIYGAFTSSLTMNEIEVKPLTSLDQAYFSIEGYALYSADDEKYLICGTTLGNIHAYKVDEKNKSLSNSGYMVDGHGIAQRNPTIHGFLTFFDAPETKGFIVSSEGGIYFYKAEGRNTKGALVLGEPTHLLQTDPDLYGGSLVVPNLCDWDGDGDLDIVSGTSLGHIYFFENKGDDTDPEFQMPAKLKAGGYDIHIQPGYNQSIQGPVESRWGYSSPTVYDWNGDGLLDILTSDSRAKFNIYVNTGTSKNPRLEPEHPLYLDGLDLFGTWRVQPGVGKMGERNAYICLDKDDEFHLYWQLDTYNLQDGGKLTIGDSIPIRANWKRGGETGRSKIVIVDWDQDGVKDLIVGTPRYASIPEPVAGLPFHLEDNGAAVLFLRNSGTEEKPVYEYPVPIRFKGKRINMGQHACSPAVGNFGPGNSLNLLVGDETGRYYFFERKDLQWDKIE